ncbi:uncharacterized protein LOC112598290 [Melanaphis sacchari]|uniref:uncharacterized protein LOC112598290 n=1 Tax=Melanaphis sacchari TaxID=742174 RepID=UPI000DC142F8|nr:uncharacterized protein LOC112598290 [Melanaphis sacchari]
METVFTEGIVVCLKTYVQQMIFEGKISEECLSIFTNIFDMIENSFTNFKTEHKRFSYYAEQGSFIKPEEKVVGQRLNTVMKSGISFLKPFNCTEQFIPLRIVLKKFFSLENILTETLDYMCSLKNESGILSNFIQGTYWKSRMKKHEGRFVLPLFMFFDDYESGNVLGSHSDIPSFTGNLYFELGLILGDNLGIHSITGFVESFSSNFCCRICTMGKSDIKVKCYEDKSLLRSNEQYFNDLKKNDLSATGLKEECIWFNVTDFSLFDQVGVDLLNDRIFAFDYGPENNKPCMISMDHINVGKMKQSASEMLSFIRYFGLLIGDFVPTGEPIWDLYLTLRRVLDITLSTSHEVNNCMLLETAVGEMNELYLKLSKNVLKPKFHFLTHYPTIIKKHGPVVHLWSMRYEAKHRISKISARSSFNRRNICMSLAIKHQLQLKEVFNKGKLCSTINVGSRKILNSLKLGKIKTELNLSNDESLVRCTGTGNEESWGPVYKWLKSGGTRPSEKLPVSIRKMDGTFTCSLRETGERLLEQLVPQDSDATETAGQAEIHRETGVYVGRFESALPVLSPTFDPVEPCTVDEVRDAIRRMITCKAPGLDGIMAGILRQAWPVLKNQITFALNTSLATRTF